jgi:hypothetical protein
MENPTEEELKILKEAAEKLGISMEEMMAETVEASMRRLKVLLENEAS